MNTDDIQWIRAPFSSLREESVLLERYASLQVSSSPASVALTLSNNISTTSTSTCVNGVTMSLDELNQDADVARLQLFARHPHTTAGASDDAAKDPSTTKPAKKRPKATTTSGVNVMSLVLKEPSLQGQSPEAAISTQRQAKKGALIERMFQAIDTCTPALGHRPLSSCPSSNLSLHEASHTTTFAPPRVLAPSSPSERHSFAQKLFSVASCRMQLTLLKAMPVDVRRACVVDLVASILDFPALALSGTSTQTAEDATLQAMYSFAQDIMTTDGPNAMADGMLLVLALGVATGQAHFLLHVASRLLSPDNGLNLWAESTCTVQYDRLFHRFQMSEPETSLGVLAASSLVHQLRIQPATTTDDSTSKVSIATDGAYLYMWSTATGLKKIGMGTGGSVLGRVYANVPAASYLPYFGPTRPVLRAVCGAVEVVALSPTLLETAPTVHDAFGDGQLLVVFKTIGNTNVIQDVLFDALERISLPATAVVVLAAFGTLVDVTPAIQHLSGHNHRGVFSDSMSPLANAQLLVVQSPLPGEHNIRFHLVQKGDVVFKPMPPVKSTSVVCIEKWLYLNVTCSETTPATLEFVQIGTTDLRVKSVVDIDVLEQRSNGVRLQWITEGDFLYDVRFRVESNIMDVHVYDLPVLSLAKTTLSWVRSVAIPLTSSQLTGSLKNIGEEALPCYTNGRTLAVVTRVDGAPSASSLCFQLDLQRNGKRTATLPTTAEALTSLATAAVCFDAATNMLWSVTSSRDTVEGYRTTNASPLVYIRDKVDHKGAVVSPVQAWNLIHQANPPSSGSHRWLVGIFAKLHEWAGCELKQDSVVRDELSLAVDICDETFHVLLHCITTYADRFCRGDVLHGWEEYVLMSSLVVLTANVRRLSVNEHAHLVHVVVTSRLAPTLSSLVRYPDLDHPIVQAALHLYKASLDIFYQGPVDQLALVATYLEHRSAHTLHASELPILKLVLQRLTSVETLHELVAHPTAFEYLDVLLSRSVKWHLENDAADDDDVARQLVAVVYAMTQALLWGYHRQRIPELGAWARFEAIVQAAIQLAQATPAERIDRLEHTLVGQVCPLLFTAMQHFPWTPAKTTYERMCDLLGQLVELVGPLNKQTSKCHDDQNETVVDTTTTVVQTVESAHDYANNMHLLTELTIPGASTLTITFDKRSRTEAAYDYVTFYKDESQTDFYGDEKYSGRGDDDDHNWPGVGSRPPLVIEAESCHVLFHTDGSGVDWGYKFTAVGLVVSHVTCLSLPWLAHVEETLMVLLTSMATTLVRGKAFTPLSTAETNQRVLLNSRLLQGGKQQTADHVVGFLKDLVDHPLDDESTTAAATVVKTLKKQTVQDQGSIAHVNRAVRAVAAAILHHNLWGMDVYEMGQASGPAGATIVPHVLQAWKTAQKMRQWFDIGDAADATVHRVSAAGRPTGLKRQPSAYKGQSEEAMVQLCQVVVERALFLLEFTPASFSFVRAAKLRWNLLAKYSTAIHRKNSWMHLVTELNAATELKSMLDYRRTSMERLHMPKTVTELVLEFVQSDVDVGEMQAMLETRNDRAGSRVVGMATIARALGASSSGRLQHVLLEGLACTMRAIGLEDCCATSLHFFNSLNGCAEAKRKALSEAVAHCLKASADILTTRSSSKCLAAEGDSGALVSSALKAMAMDYDVRDSYLLYDSKVLPHILRLLPSDNVRVRRVAQAIIRVLMSHFVAIPDQSFYSTDMGLPTLSAFQKQLLAAVRLQLEGIVGTVQHQVDSPYTALCLTRNHAGYCAPFVAVLPNHSISFWLFVEEQACQYALKVGDEVRRGPHWISSQDEDGGDAGVGTIVSIQTPTTVQVKWQTTSTTSVYTWDPSVPLYEVQLVDEGVGGMVFLHGNRNLVSDTEEMAAWSHYGMFLTDEGQIKYIVSSGAPDKDSIFESTDSVHWNAWNHVCLVKEDAHLRLYLNGALDSQHVLDDHIPSTAAHEVLIESVHPCFGHGDGNRWPVSFPGATRLVVTFDPLTQLDKSNGDFICFFASADEAEVWGQPMYSHSFPGVNQECSLVIPSDSTVVYFHSSSQTVKWGFRLLVAAEYDDDRQFHDVLNTFPFYFGEPPSRVLDAPSARCWVSHFSVLNAPLQTHDVALRMRLDSQECTPYAFPVDRTLQTLGLIQTCAETQFGRSFITNSVLIRHLMVVAFMGAAETQCGALYVLVELAPTLSTALVDDAFGRAFPASSSGSFLDSVWENLGAILNVWPSTDALHPSVQCHVTVETQPAALSAMSLVQAYLSLVRALARSSRDWLDRVHALLLSSMEHTDSPHEMSLVLASVAVLGGTYDGVGIGSRVRCCVNIDGKESVEVGSVIQFRLKGEARMASVLFDCDNSRPVDVPISDVTVDDDNDEEADGMSAVNTQHLWDNDDTTKALLGRLERLLHKWQRIDAASDKSVDPRRYKPRTKSHDKVQVLESDHPYANDTHTTVTLDFPGADAILIVFDPMTSTEPDCDFVRFVKREIGDERSGATYGDDKYSGVHFPGVGAVPPLRIPASSVDVVFHTDSTTTDWGYRLHATATTESLVLPPETPPSPSKGAWGDLRARIFKVLSRHAHVLAPSWTRTLMGEMARTAVMPYTGRPLTSMPKSQVFESKHPYANSISEYMAVTFKGANLLSISFDPLSRTEHGCDYVVFFKDKSLGDRWGDHQYTGRAGSENWPGVGGRPPLLIPAEGFTLLWCTDSSNVDWGWKFIVKATFPSLSPLELTSEQLNQRAYHVTEMLYEQTQYQAMPRSRDFDGFEEDEGAEVKSPFLLLPPSPPPAFPSKSSKWHRIQSFDNVGLYERPDDKAAVVDVLTHNIHVKILNDSVMDWVHVETKGGDVGWIRKRKGDVWVIQPLDPTDLAVLIDEDTVLVGIDDEPFDHQPPVVDDTNEEQDELANFASHFTLEELKGHAHRLHSMAVETYYATAIHSARRSLMTVFSTLTPCPLTSLSTSPTLLLELLVMFLTQRSLMFPHLVKAKLQLQLFQWLDSSPALLSAVVSYSTSILNHTIQTLQSHRRAMVRTLESPHPYTDNADTYWRVNMPGAKCIKIVFDSRSKTEAGCDWLCFYAATDRHVTYGEAQYSGRGGSENWPGFGNRPPLIIDSDRFEVYFHSDGSGTDWGWAFTAYGIVSSDNPSCPPNSSVVDMEKPMVACWLLHALTATPLKSSNVEEAVLNNALVLQTWIDCLTGMPRQVKLQVLAMITNVALDHSVWARMTPCHVNLWSNIRTLVKQRMRSQHKCEERQELKSMYLQALIQCAMALDVAVESCGYPSTSTSFAREVVQKPTGDTTTAYTVDTTSLSVSFANTTLVHAWTFEAKSVVGTVLVGIRRNDGWNIQWTTSVAKDAPPPPDMYVDTNHVLVFNPRDVIRVEMDLERLVLLRNNAKVLDKRIPPPSSNSTAVLHPVVTVFNPSDIVIVSAAPSLRIPVEFPDPAWYVKALDSMSALWTECASFDSRTRHRRRPLVATRESSHPLADDSWVDTIQIPDAVKLEIRFDRQTQLDAKDTIVLSSSSTEHHQSHVLTGLDGKASPNHAAFGPPEDSKTSLRAGDVVVRHDRDWVYGDEDGGPGDRGTVTEIVGWKHRSGAGVKVKWTCTGHENVYRYGYNGYFDVVLLSTAVAPPPSVLWIEGDTVQVSVTPFRLAHGKDASGFRGSVDFNRHMCLVLPITPAHLTLGDDFSIQFWIRLADFKDDKRPQTIFFAGHPASSPVLACLHLSVASDFKLRLAFKTDDFVDSLVTEPLVPVSHTWTHITITSSGSDVVLYKFGEKWASHTFYGRSSYTTPFHTMLWGHHIPPNDTAGRPGFRPFGGLAGQLYDIQLWDAPLSSTEICRTLFAKQTSGGNDLYPPPPLPPSSLNPWTTINKSGKDFTSVRSDVCIRRGQAYFEATLLSGGTVLVGWVEAGSWLRRKTAGIGDCASSYAIDVNRQYMWHNGPSPFAAPKGVRGNAGDVLGCWLDVEGGVMSFTLNGVTIGDSFTAPKAVTTTSPTRTSSASRQSAVLKIAPLLSPRNGRSAALNSTPRSMSSYEVKVAELMGMGCTRQSAIEALERNDQSVPRALEWLLHHDHPEDKPSTDRVSGPAVALVDDATPVPNQWQHGHGFHAAVSLSPMGGQGVVWNLGQSPFVHPPQGLTSPSVWSHRVASTTTATDQPQHAFQVFDWAEDGWETIKVRHNLLDMTPQLLHQYVLDEGDGLQVRDAKGGPPGELVSTETSSLSSSPLKPWKGWIYSPIHNQGTVPWGFKFTVFGHFHRNSLPKMRFVLRGGYNPLESHRKAALQLVQYVNKKARPMDVAHVVRAPWAEFALRDEDWVRWPLLCELASGASIPSPDSPPANGFELNQAKLAQCFKWLQEFNLVMHCLLPLVHFEAETSDTTTTMLFGQFKLSAMIGACRGLIFQALKKGLWDDCLKRTQRSGVSLEMTLNRPKAMRHRAAGLVDTEARTTLFGQAFRQLNSSENHHFRRSDNVYYVKFLGENAEDAGGPYRETFAQYASELHSAQIPMMLRTANAAHNVGVGREKWVVNPSAFASVRLRRRMFTFLGKVMGASVRSKDFLALDLAGLLWKLLVNDGVSVDDLEGVDKMLVQSMSKMRSIDQVGVTEDMFEDIVLETFTTLSTDNRVVEIKPHGASIAVTFSTRVEFADLVEHFRLHEFDTVVRYVQEGLAKVLPLNLMSLFTATEFESMVCGCPEVDVDLLAQCTEYSSCAATDMHIVWFWSTLRKFSHEERSAFLRFVWGRSRLPHSVAEFPQWFKLQSFNKSPADTYLPVAHTCFFALELPSYTSEELLMKKLLYAIYNCQEIDADGDSVAANQLGWEE